MSEITDNTRLINMILLIILGTVLLIGAVSIYKWTRDQKDVKPLGDVDWDKEKERLLQLAAEKKASRKLNKADAKSEKREDSK